MPKQQSDADVCPCCTSDLPAQCGCGPKCQCGCLLMCDCGKCCVCCECEPPAKA